MVKIPAGEFTLGLNPSSELIPFMSDKTSGLNAQPKQTLFLETFYIDAANISIIPQEHVDMSRKRMSGMWVEFDNDFTVTVNDNSLIIGDRYQIQIGWDDDEYDEDE